MKTLVFRNNDSTTRVEVQVDLFASNTDLVTSGFDTRFTNMYIDGDTNAAIILGIDLKEIENNFQGAVAKAKSISDIGLYAFDASYPNLAQTTQVDNILLTGTSGTANVSIDGTDYLAKFATSLTVTATNFVSTHAATISSAEGVTVTANGENLVFTAGTAGTAVEVSITNATGDLDGTLTHTTLNQTGGGEVTIVPTHHVVE